MNIQWLGLIEYGGGRRPLRPNPALGPALASLSLLCPVYSIPTIKIATENQDLLPDGRHLVEITSIEEGTSEHQNVPFFAARMESADGFVSQRFYNSPAGHPIILSLYAAVGIQPHDGKALDTKNLISKHLLVEVSGHSYTDPATSNERTIRQATGFRAA